MQTIQTGFKESRAIATDSNGTIYVAGDSEIHIFDSINKQIKKIPLDFEPLCLTASQGKFFIGSANYIEIHDNQTGQVIKWPVANKKSVFTSIAVSKNDCFVADAGKKVILHYNIDGTLLNKIDGKKNGGKGFAIPSPYFDVAIAPDGLLRITNTGNHRIEAYTFEGDMEFYWGEYSDDENGFCACCNPVNFAILKDGSFVTVEKGIIRVKIYDAQGNFKSIVANANELLGSSEFNSNCFDVAIDANDRILVLDTIKNTIKIFVKKDDNVSK